MLDVWISVKENYTYLQGHIKLFFFYYCKTKWNKLKLPKAKTYKCISFKKK